MDEKNLHTLMIKMQNTIMTEIETESQYSNVKILGPFIREKIRRVLSKTRADRINGTK